MSAASDSSKRNRPVIAGPSARVESSVSFEQRSAMIITVTAAVVAVAAMILYLVLALNWSKQPFMGALMSRTLVIDGSQPTQTGTWPGLVAGLERLDRITSINGQKLSANPTDYETAYQAFLAISSRFHPNRVIRIEFERPARNGVVTTTRSVRCEAVVNGIAPCAVSLPLRSFPVTDFVALFVIPYASGLLLLVAGLVLLRMRSSQPTALLVSTLCFSQSIFIAGLFDQNTTRLLIPLWIFATVMSGGCMGLLALIFPIRSVWLYSRPFLRFVPIGISLALAAVLLMLNARPPYPSYATDNFLIAVFGALCGLGALVFSLLRRRTRATTPIVRDQSNTVLIGIALAAAPIGIWLINVVTRPLLGVSPIAFNERAAAPFFILPAISLVYAIFQYRAMNTDRIVSQAITYAMMLFALIIGYFLLVFGVTLIAGQFVNANDASLMALTIFVIAVLFIPLRTRLQGRIDELYFRARRNYQNQIETFAQKLTVLVKFDEIMQEFRAQLESALTPTQVFVFLPDRDSGEFIAFGNPKPETDVRFGGSSSLVALLREGEEFIYLEPGRPWPPELVVERARIMILNSLVVVGFRGGNQLNGFVSIGPPRSGAGAYNFESLRFIQSLTRQISVAVERAQVVNSLERRVRELDVLSQVSQAVNFTANFDDLLELISTQADKLIEASHFYIVLRDASTDELYYAFFLEDDERYRERENKRWPVERDLFSEIVRSGQSLRVPNYAKAMQERNTPIKNEDPNMKAWVGVPLVAGSSTVGVLAAGATRPDKVYTDDQLKIFADIGALAATSLEKARLFDETNSRARQLAALNDISRQLVAYESDIEKLLALITQNAVDILGAEAGSLLLTVDDKSGDLEFKVVTGGSGKELIGSRLPAKRGLVGQVASTGEVIIVNDAANDPRWGGELSKGMFKTSSVLAVPLKTQSAVIGVLEVLNKKGVGSFVKDDADLLTTFAGQAAVAIENARLFQLTDYQLSERVTELETMERIDVELNRSLELHKVAEITLRYAMEHSTASSGLLGIVSTDGHSMDVVAMLGYDRQDFPEGAEGTYWPIDKGIVSRVMRTKRADLVTDTAIDPNYVPSLRGATSQITVPMLSGGAINSILILEKVKDPRLSLVEMAFVQRLAEHASIAIANAQLYAELNRANQSKSEFVSFVAHELKNPLTSIKGYSDVLISGAVGQMNEQQRNFLGTIRFNADRMNTLVSDLNDVTKLQLGELRIELSPTSFRNIVTETLRPLQKQIEDKEQELAIDMPDNLPDIDADQNRLIQVLTNLVSNAHKYSPSGGKIAILGEIVNNRRDSKGKALGPALHVSVQDTGIGMSEEDLTRLFTPYFRSENPLAREQPGTGLGLTITRGIILRHGGEIWVESTVGVGTTFHFTVPLSAENVQVPK
jgi:signal transduction histidine kinase